MDVTTVTGFRRARTRDDLTLAAGEVVMAGGTWLMSEPQPDTTGFVDLTTMDWPAIEVTADGLRIGATCTIAELVAWSHMAPAEWTAARVIPVAANALLASFKIWNTATVGGNLCRSFAAGAMISYAAALDGVAEVWSPRGDYRLAVAELPTGNGTNVLAADEVLRAIEIPAHALRSRLVLQKIALAELGRSGAVVTGRVDEDGACVFGVTAAVQRPVILRFPAVPDAATLADAIGDAPGYYTDALGAADWRHGVSVALGERIRAELGDGPSTGSGTGGVTRSLSEERIRAELAGCPSTGSGTEGVPRSLSEERSDETKRGAGGPSTGSGTGGVTRSLSEERSDETKRATPSEGSTS